MGFKKQQKKFRHIIHMYVPIKSQDKVEEAQKILERENSSLSQFCVAKLEEYANLHREGNPQTLISRFGAEPSLTCYRCQNKFPSLTRVEYISGLVAHVCPECLKLDKQKRLVKKMLGTV